MQATTRPDIVVGPQGKAPSVTVYTDGGNGVAEKQVLHIPTSRSEMSALLARRGQLSDQLSSVTNRRNRLIEQIRVAPRGTEEGLQAQLQVLDNRILQLENDLGTVGREVAAASPQLISMAEYGTRPNDGRFVEGMAAMGVPLFIVMSAVYFFSRRRWKREARGAQPTLPSADSERLQRLEHGFDAMAVEIERISEGQRFVTRLLSEKHASETTVGR